MRDIEIIKWLENLKPETNNQALEIKEAIKCITKGGFIDDFIKFCEYDDLDGIEVNEIFNEYEMYLSYCELKDFGVNKIPFSRYICNTYGLTVVNESGKRIYRRCL